MPQSHSYFQQIKLGLSTQFDLFQLHQLHPERYPFLLESVAQGDLGQFDILFAFPQQTLTCHSKEEADEFIHQFTDEFKQLKTPAQSGSQLPFSGGWFSYFSYDYAEVVEPILSLPKSDHPLAKMVRVPCAVIYSHEERAYYWVAENEYQAHFAKMQADIDTLLALTEKAQKAASESASSSAILAKHEEPNLKYLDGVKTIKEYILSGDIFQVNLSREWQVDLNTADSFQVYQSLRENNPAPFAAFVDFKDWKILSSSPERLVKFDNEWVETRPIAGTRKRSPNQALDQALIDELISHPKERAEHIMLIDLERNDLGRICQPGSVEVNELMAVETYEHVHHIVSNIRGKLSSGFSPLDIIHAVFPGGTITGCPKIRCMEIIAELEQMPRKAYTGSLGYINRDGSLDFNILIRTMLMQGSTVSFRAGAGIVADSDPDFELEESHHKAKGLINALDAIRLKE